MLRNPPYISIPKLGTKHPDDVAINHRCKEIAIEAEQLFDALGLNWIPAGGDVSYTAWSDYYASNQVVMYYPGTRIMQPEWWWNDVWGFNKLEHIIYLHHELNTLLEAIGIPIDDD